MFCCGSVVVKKLGW